jgi:hypothetical protein
MGSGESFTVEHYGATKGGWRLLRSIPATKGGTEVTVVRFIVASPVFHRWHHTKETEVVDKNFAGLLPLRDAVFGALYLPHDRRPVDFGTRDPVPPDFLGQLMYPWRARDPRVSSSGRT